jgi:hypothetical protein
MSVVELNVGGRLFTTREATLIGQGSPFFIGMLRDYPKGAPDVVVLSNGTFFIDRDGDLFAPLLQFLRTGKLAVGRELLLEDVQQEARYYGIQLPSSSRDYGRLVFYPLMQKRTWSVPNERVQTESNESMTSVSAFLKEKQRDGWVVESCGYGETEHNKTPWPFQWWVVSSCNASNASAMIAQAPPPQYPSSLEPPGGMVPSAPRLSSIVPLQQSGYVAPSQASAPPHYVPARSVNLPSFGVKGSRK